MSFTQKWCRKEVVMENSKSTNSNLSISAKPVEEVTLNLKYLTATQAQELINMFDSPEAYAENFSALKGITRGLYKIIDDTNPSDGDPVSRMFHTVNNLQGILLLDDMQEVERIIHNSGLMPNVWRT
jgi:hypothetical protein